MAADIDLVRTYDARKAERGEGAGAHTFLIDRLWPRGIAKTELVYDSWIKNIAPSAQLRKWFGHEPAKFEKFRERYRAELDANRSQAAPIVAALAEGPVRLLYSAKDTAHNQAVVLKEWLLER